MLTENGFNALYGSLAAKLVNWLVANGTEYGTACDIVQETFLRLWNHRGDFEKGEVPNSWLYVTASRLRADHWRKGRAVDLREDMETTAGEDGKLLSTTQNYGDVLLRERLVKALSMLPEAQRTAYTLFQVGQNSIRDIAEMTSATENLVKVRIHRARKRLQELLADLETDLADD